MQEYIFDINPRTAPRLVYSDKWSKRPEAVRYFGYKKALQTLALAIKFVPQDRLSFEFHVEMPPSWSKKKRQAMNGKPHQQKPDIDNLTKAFMDALNKDDSYVHSICASKVWAEKGYIKVTTYEVTE